METRHLRKNLRAAALVGLFIPALLFAQAGGGPDTGGTSGTGTIGSGTGIGTKALSSSDKKFITHTAEASLAGHMVDEHQKDVKEFERQSTKADDPQLRAFAEKNLGTLREHLQQAKDTETAVKGGAKSAERTSSGYR